MTDSTEGKDHKTGRFLPGNRFWEARSSHGRNPIFASPDDLWTGCREYFEWVEANPLYKDQLVSYQGETKHEPVALMRAMTQAGLCIFLDIDRKTWAEYAKLPDFSPVTTRAEEIIYSQKFAGAAADLLNANIIARDLGLADERKLSGGLSITDERTPEEIAKGIESKFAGIIATGSETIVPEEPDAG
jgi:hypothetical protein